MYPVHGASAVAASGSVKLNNDTQPVVWIVDDDASIRWVLEKALHGDGIQTHSFDRADALLAAFAEQQPDVLLTDIRMPGMDGIEMMGHLGLEASGLPVIVMTAHADLDSAVAAFQGGAFEYLPKPFDIDLAVSLVRRACKVNEPEVVREQTTISSISSMIGQASAMQDVFRTIGRLSSSSMNVLITGESGTGKELVAQALHEHSPRASRPFIALNTTAIAAELLESELFGHERGAFTGADSRRIGRFEQADSGTLFLDEIGDMSPDLQTRLLRVLAEGEFYRVGGQTPISVDVRVVAATNQDLAQAVEENRFREDLFHRLNVIHIRTPPLRERAGDIPLLLQHYINVAARELEVEPKRLTATAETLLCSFDWPGNVRQLVNICRRLTVTAPGSEIRASDIPEEIGSNREMSSDPDWLRNLASWAERQLANGQLENNDQQPLLEIALPEFERTLIRAALTSVNGRRQDAAKLLGWGRNTLTRKIRDLDLDL
ncbi:MAG: nitrogen regulation protein NR(I) [Chromatiales bacterium]|nr:nitrogen regulation protein NR(I) [Chromatiales bacterium]